MMGFSDGNQKPMNPHIIIPDEFYLSEDVVGLARDMIGKLLIKRNENDLMVSVITETEAYAGETDRASHAWNGRRTARTEVMYSTGGVCYVYLCYGMHHLLNIVTAPEGIPHAVLIRSILPLSGFDSVKKTKTGAKNLIKSGIGPGRLTRLLGIDMKYNGQSLCGGEKIWIEDCGLNFKEFIAVTKRIGIDYAGADAELPYRFVVESEIADREIKKAGLF